MLYATWGHKAIHSSGHVPRLKRDLSGAFGSRSDAPEELVAELGSLLLGRSCFATSPEAPSALKRQSSGQAVSATIQLERIRAN